VRALTGQKLARFAASQLAEVEALLVGHRGEPTCSCGRPARAAPMAAVETEELMGLLNEIGARAAELCRLAVTHGGLACADCRIGLRQSTLRRCGGARHDRPDTIRDIARRC
jgi:hypothetical protein